MAAKDPYRYFREEARELLAGLTEGAAALETGGRDPDRILALLRHAHTLKGAARVVRLPAISDLAHRVEDILEPIREGSDSLSAAEFAKLRGMLEAIRENLSSLDKPPPADSGNDVAPAQSLAHPSLDTIRLQAAEVNSVLADVSEMAAKIDALRSDIRELETCSRQARLLQALSARSRTRPAGAKAGASLQANAGELAGNLETLRRRAADRTERLDRHLQRLHAEASQLRLIQADALRPILESAARDAAETLGKRVLLEMSCRTLRLDAPVFACLQEALMHLVRNAVAHGIETEAVRAAQGKPPVGTIRVKIEHHVDRLELVCSDDGAGVDVEGIRRAALAKGISMRAENMAAAVDLLLQGGLTTTRDVDEVSGRGIGINAVRAAAGRLGGSLSMKSEADRGTEAFLSLPMTFSAIEALAVECSGSQALLPLGSIRRVAKVKSETVRRLAHRNELHLDDEAMPFASLSGLLVPGARRSSGDPSLTVVVIGDGARSAALGVDRLLGVVEAVVRPLPNLADAAEFVAGASAPSHGAPRLVLEPAELVAAIDSANPEGPAPASEPLPILVIDDSLTTRMLEQSILESAGYSVDLAVSGEDGLKRLRTRRYGLILVDVEMPGMDGFAVIEHLRREPEWREIPAILVTSREANEDRQRGLDAGAQDYIVKGDFDQRRLLRRISELLA